MQTGNEYNWRVVDQMQTTRVTASNRFEDVYEFTIEMPWGGSFTIQIPVAIFTPDRLAQMAEAQAIALTNARFLSG